MSATPRPPLKTGSRSDLSKSHRPRIVNPHIVDMPQHAEDAEKPQDNHDKNDDIEDLFDLGIEGNVAIDQPQEDANDDQGDDDMN
jgi:hypothetical protein